MKKVLIIILLLSPVYLAFSQPNIKQPGVYIEEISTLPTSVAQVETAIPAFIGFTEKGPSGEPTLISSMADFERLFGANYPTSYKVGIFTGNVNGITKIKRTSESKFYLYYSLRNFFDNGGENCYIVSLGNFDSRTNATDDTTFNEALDEVQKIDEVTLLVFPDALFLSQVKYYSVVNHALSLCAQSRDRFTIIDIHPGDNPTPAALETEMRTGNNFRDASLDLSSLKYGAAYTPYLNTSYSYQFNDADVKIETRGGKQSFTLDDPQLLKNYPQLYKDIKRRLKANLVVLPPSGAIAGIYAKTDRTHGVWKAPANVSVASVSRPSVIINNNDQGLLNEDPVTGKSINAIRYFTGKGTMVWGARTLAGNDNEWRYVPVRRFFNMVEESVLKSTAYVVFEPNDANIWSSVKTKIGNYLENLWRQGALQGPTPSQAYYVKVGLGETMTAQDILENRMIVEIGMAIVRPAEFVTLSLEHKVGQN